MITEPAERCCEGAESDTIKGQLKRLGQIATDGAEKSKCGFWRARLRRLDIRSQLERAAIDGGSDAAAKREYVGKPNEETHAYRRTASKTSPYIAMRIVGSGGGESFSK
jgi:hypothetical protein